jgi:hypothetical protein
LHDDVATLDGFNTGSLTDPKLVKGTHLACLWSEGKQRGLAVGCKLANQNLAGCVAADAETNATKLQQTGAACPKHTQPAAQSNPELRHTADPARFAGYFLNFGPIARMKGFEGHQRLNLHDGLLQSKDSQALIRY